jgi:hypothetical protein
MFATVPQITSVSMPQAAARTDEVVLHINHDQRGPCGIDADLLVQVVLREFDHAAHPGSSILGVQAIFSPSTVTITYQRLVLHVEPAASKRGGHSMFLSIGGRWRRP